MPWFRGELLRSRRPLRFWPIGATLETAALVTAWEPDAESERQMSGPLELARTLEEAVKANPAEWSAAPQDVVTTLGQPLYIEHYFRALTEQAADIVPQAPAVLAAALDTASCRRRAGSRPQHERSQL